MGKGTCGSWESPVAWIVGFICINELQLVEKLNPIQKAPFWDWQDGALFM